jgi:predicted glycoside hydrolase/deacetylase ChbG (UPF0249 family)
MRPLPPAIRLEHFIQYLKDEAMGKANLTSEQLGFSSSDRLLILNIDDVGFSLTANLDAIDTLDQGAATSCTVMVPTAWSLHACSLMRSRPDISHGIHLTAISEHEIFRWRPLTSREKIPSIVDGEGFFPLESEKEIFLARAEVTELEIEWRAQIETAYQRGLKPVQLDSHCNIHDAREDIFDMTIRLAREYGLAVRVNRPDIIEKIKRLGLPVVDHACIDSYRIPTRNKSERYKRLLCELPAGISEWALHCARGTREIRTIDPDWRVRSADYQFFNSKECRQLVQSEGIRLISYDLLQPYWKK